MQKVMIAIVILAGSVSFAANAVAQNDRAASFSSAMNEKFRVAECALIRKCQTVLGKRICWNEAQCPSGAVRG